MYNPEYITCSVYAGTCTCYVNCFTNAIESTVNQNTRQKQRSWLPRVRVWFLQLINYKIPTEYAIRNVWSLVRRISMVSIHGWEIILWRVLSGMTQMTTCEQNNPVVMPFCWFFVGLESFHKQSGLLGFCQQSGVKVLPVKISITSREHCLYTNYIVKIKFVFEFLICVSCSDDVLIL